MAYQDARMLEMLETRKEIQECKDPIQRAHQQVKGICDSTGCVAEKATHAGREYLFCCFRKTCRIGTTKLGIVIEFRGKSDWTGIGSLLIKCAIGRELH